MNALITICRLIAHQLAPITLLGAFAAYLYPPLFLIFKDSFLWFFAATMFAIGIVLDTGELRGTLRHPGRIGLGVMTQFTVMPALGFARWRRCCRRYSRRYWSSGWAVHFCRSPSGR